MSGKNRRKGRSKRVQSEKPAQVPTNGGTSTDSQNKENVKQSELPNDNKDTGYSSKSSPREPLGLVSNPQFDLLKSNPLASSSSKDMTGIIVERQADAQGDECKLDSQDTVVAEGPSVMVKQIRKEELNNDDEDEKCSALNKSFEIEESRESISLSESDKDQAPVSPSSVTSGTEATSCSYVSADDHMQGSDEITHIIDSFDEDSSCLTDSLVLTPKPHSSPEYLIVKLSSNTIEKEGSLDTEMDKTKALEPANKRDSEEQSGSEDLAAAAAVNQIELDLQEDVSNSKNKEEMAESVQAVYPANTPENSTSDIPNVETMPAIEEQPISEKTEEIERNKMEEEAKENAPEPDHTRAAAAEAQRIEEPGNEAIVDAIINSEENQAPPPAETDSTIQDTKAKEQKQPDSSKSPEKPQVQPDPSTSEQNAAVSVPGDVAEPPASDKQTEEVTAEARFDKASGDHSVTVTTSGEAKPSASSPNTEAKSEELTQSSKEKKSQSKDRAAVGPTAEPGCCILL